MNVLVYACVYVCACTRGCVFCVCAFLYVCVNVHLYERVCMRACAVKQK